MFLISELIQFILIVKQLEAVLTFQMIQTKQCFFFYASHTGILSS